jgi:hypothetical protein
MPVNRGPLLLLGVWATLFVAFAIVNGRAMKRLRAHRIRRRPGQSTYSGWRILTGHTYAYDPESYDEEGKRILQTLHDRMAVLFATWAAAGLIYAFLRG